MPTLIVSPAWASAAQRVKTYASAASPRLRFIVLPPLARGGPRGRLQSPDHARGCPFRGEHPGLTFDQVDENVRSPSKDDKIGARQAIGRELEPVMLADSSRS